MAKIVELIRTQLTRGAGKTEADPVRTVHQLWTKDGRLVAECDTWNGDSHWTAEDESKP